MGRGPYCARGLRTAIIVLSTGLAALASPNLARAAPLDPDAGWSASYLMNTVMLREYEAVLAHREAEQQTSSRKKATKDPKGAGSASAVGDKGILIRARFALAAAAARGQVMERSDDLGARITHDVASGKSGGPDDQRLAANLEKAARSWDHPEEPAVQAGFAAVRSSFARPEAQAFWSEAQRFYLVPNLTCSLPSEKILSYVAHSRDFMAKSGSDQSTSPERLLSPVAALSPPDMRCLVLTLARDQLVPLSEHLALLLALRASSAVYLKDVALSALASQRLIEQRRYPEALAVLLELADVDPAFRLPYELLQRVFNARQRGAGAVALQGI